MSNTHRLPLNGLLVLLVVILGAASASAAPASVPELECGDEDWYVTNQDELIYAIDCAEALAGADTIFIENDIELTHMQNNYGGINALPVVGSELTIEGGGHSLRRNTVNELRILATQWGSDLLVNNLTMENGFQENARGGAVSNVGVMTLVNCTVRDSGVPLTDFPSHLGGGISNGVNSTLTLVNTTVSDNQASSGGGIYNASGATLTLINSTVSGNFANRYGGGIFNWDGAVFLSNTTIVGNTAEPATGLEGGGIRNEGGPVTLGHTIIADNIAATEPDCSRNASFGSFISQGYNLIEEVSGCALGGDLTGNLTGIDPSLGPLDDNGGPTPTHLPAGNSRSLTVVTMPPARVPTSVAWPARTWPATLAPWNCSWTTATRFRSVAWSKVIATPLVPPPSIYRSPKPARWSASPFSGRRETVPASRQSSQIVAISPGPSALPAATSTWTSPSRLTRSRALPTSCAVATVVRGLVRRIATRMLTVSVAAGFRPFLPGRVVEARPARTHWLSS